MKESVKELAGFIIGVVIGAFVFGLVSNRLKFTMDVAPGSTKKIRIIGAIIGGVLFGFGSQLLHVAVPVDRRSAEWQFFQQAVS